MIFFYQIPYIIESPEMVVKYKKIADSNIECEFLIFELKHGVCLHLGIEKDDSGLFYIPRTFFVQPDFRDELKYVRGQTQIVVTAFTKTERATGGIINQIPVPNVSSETA